MNSIWLIVVIPVVLSLLVNEFCDLSPWLAKKLIPHAAKLWSLGDPDLAEIRAEEWAAIIEDVPGKLTKLGQAILFLGGATWRYQRWHFATKATLLLVALALVLGRLAGRAGTARPGDKEVRLLDEAIRRMMRGPSPSGAGPAPQTVRGTVVIPMAATVKSEDIANLNAERIVFLGDPTQLSPFTESDPEA